VSASLLLSPGTLVGGDFRVVSPLAQGGMGAIYVAEQLSTGKPRALKTLRPDVADTPELRQRFAQEARIGARIASEHVVEVVGAGVDHDGRLPWLAMELLEGRDLSTVVERGGPQPPGFVRAVLGELCHAVGAAHDAGIVHRDLKPENVFLAAARRVGVPFTVKVLDFGIAKLVQEVGKRTTGALGSPLWMAPEQTEAAAITPATDVWALGLIAYFALTGGSFWRAATHPEATLAMLLREMLLEPIPSASARAHEQGRAATLPPGFDAWFARAVARQADARFTHARECMAALSLVFDRAGVLAAPSSGSSGLAQGSLAPPPAEHAPPTPGPYASAPSGPYASAPPGPYASAPPPTPGPYTPAPAALPPAYTPAALERTTARSPGAASPSAPPLAGPRAHASAPPVVAAGAQGSVPPANAFGPTTPLRGELELSEPGPLSVTKKSPSHAPPRAPRERTLALVGLGALGAVLLLGAGGLGVWLLRDKLTGAASAPPSGPAAPPAGSLGGASEPLETREAREARAGASPSGAPTSEPSSGPSSEASPPDASASASATSTPTSSPSASPSAAASGAVALASSVGAPAASGPSPKAGAAKGAEAPLREGFLPDGLVEGRLRAKMPSFNACFSNHRRDHGGPDTGHLKTRFVIGEGGYVTSASVQATDLPAPVTSCVMGVIRALPFPKPEGGPVIVFFPIRFVVKS
jgi:serine/threonine protein kinase